MKVKIALIMIAVALAGCGKETTPVDRLKIQQMRVERLNAQAHACDRNDGVVDITGGQCGRYGCSATIIVCKDGMQKSFDN